LTPQKAALIESSTFVVFAEGPFVAGAKGTFVGVDFRCDLKAKERLKG